MKKKSTWTNLKLQQKLVQFEFICGFAETYLAKFILAVHPAQNPKILHLPPSMTKKKLQILVIKHLETAKKNKRLNTINKILWSTSQLSTNHCSNCHVLMQMNRKKTFLLLWIIQIYQQLWKWLNSQLNQNHATGSWLSSLSCRRPHGFCITV